MPVLALLLVPGATAIALAFQSGGFATKATAVAAVELAVLLAVWLLLAPSPFEAVSRPLVIAVAAIVGLAGWAALSAIWSLSAERAAPEAVRVVLYALTLALFGLVAATRRRARMLALGLAGGCLAICLAALASRTLPDLVSRSPGDSLDRLAYPLSYWNALGLLAAVGSVLCVHLTCHADEPDWARRLAAGALPILFPTLYATLSRGASVAAFVGVGLYLVLSRPRGLLAVVIAVAPPTAAAVAAVHVTTADRFEVLVPDSATIADGRWIATALIASALGAGILRTTVGAAPTHRAAGGVVRRDAVLIAFLAAVVAVALVQASGGTASQRAHREGDVTPSRLLSSSSSGRFAYWEVALEAAADRPLIGNGAGTFGLSWARDRETARLFVREAHSVYLEMLAELGVVGLALLLTALTTIAVSLVRRARRGATDEALWLALFAASVAWSLHAAIDWDWELPAVSLPVFAIGGAALGRAQGRVRTRPARPLRRTVARWALAAACVAVAVYSARLAIAAARLDAAVAAAECGDCETAEGRARASLRWLDQSGPYVVLASCLRNSRPAAAKQAMIDALERNPHDWRLRYDLALVLALAGEDPRYEAEAALALNPLDPGVRTAAAVFAEGTRASRRAYAGNAAFLLP